tara:strand:+ start:496 stop:1296 length:801 start_codon:yes stop_codon:yes gene_type:complete
LHGSKLTELYSHKVLVDTWTGASTGVVGDKYKVTQMGDFTKATEEMLLEALPNDKFKDMEISDSMSHGSAIRCRKYTFPAFAKPIETRKHQTDVALTVALIQSYDGSTSNGFVTGLLDFFCTNGMISGDYTKGNKRHTSGFNLSNFILDMDKVVRDFYKDIQRYQVMASTDIRIPQAEAVLEALPGMSDRLAKVMKDQYLTEVSTRGSNVWALASALTYYSSHNSEEFPVKGSASNDNVAKSLLDRSRRVNTWMNSSPFQSLLLAA